jgi:hypothetical protein
MLCVGTQGCDALRRWELYEYRKPRDAQGTQSVRQARSRAELGNEKSVDSFDTPVAKIDTRVIDDAEPHWPAENQIAVNGIQIAAEIINLKSPI